MGRPLCAAAAAAALQVRGLCDTKQGYTQYGGLRPFGVSLLYAGWWVRCQARLGCRRVAAALLLPNTAAAADGRSLEQRRQQQQQQQQVLVPLGSGPRLAHAPLNSLRFAPRRPPARLPVAAQGQAPRLPAVPVGPVWQLWGERSLPLLVSQAFLSLLSWRSLS